MTDYTKLSDAIQTYMHTLGKMIYDRSQELVPVKSGRLKKSGEYTFSRDSATISYKTPYAYRINFGGGGEQLSDAATTYRVRRHQRRVPSKGLVVVKEHMKRVGQRTPPMVRTRKGFLTQARDDILNDSGALQRGWVKAHGTPEPTIKPPRVA